MSPAFSSRSNLISAFGVGAQFCSETYRDVEVTLGAGSTTGGSIQLPYNCSTNEANLISFESPITSNRGGGKTQCTFVPESSLPSNCLTSRRNCASTATQVDLIARDDKERRQLSLRSGETSHPDKALLRLSNSKLATQNKFRGATPNCPTYPVALTSIDR